MRSVTYGISALILLGACRGDGELKFTIEWCDASDDAAQAHLWLTRTPDIGPADRDFPLDDASLQVRLIGVSETEFHVELRDASEDVLASGGPLTVRDGSRIACKDNDCSVGASCADLSDGGAPDADAGAGCDVLTNDLLDDEVEEIESRWTFNEGSSGLNAIKKSSVHRALLLELQEAEECAIETTLPSVDGPIYTRQWVRFEGPEDDATFSIVKLLEIDDQDGATRNPFVPLFPYQMTIGTNEGETADVTTRVWYCLLSAYEPQSTSFKASLGTEQGQLFQSQELFEPGALKDFGPATKIAFGAKGTETNGASWTPLQITLARVAVSSCPLLCGDPPEPRR